MAWYDNPVGNDPQQLYPLLSRFSSQLSPYDMQASGPGSRATQVRWPTPRTGMTMMGRGYGGYGGYGRNQNIPGLDSPHGFPPPSHQATPMPGVGQDLSGMNWSEAPSGGPQSWAEPPWAQPPTSSGSPFVMPQQPEQPSIFGMDPSRFSLLAGVAAHAIDPYGVGGRLGAGAAEIAAQDLRGQQAERFALMQELQRRREAKAANIKGFVPGQYILRNPNDPNSGWIPVGPGVQDQGPQFNALLKSFDAPPPVPTPASPSGQNGPLGVPENNPNVPLTSSMTTPSMGGASPSGPRPLTGQDIAAIYNSAPSKEAAKAVIDYYTNTGRLPSPGGLQYEDMFKSLQDPRMRSLMGETPPPSTTTPPVGILPSPTTPSTNAPSSLQLSGLNVSKGGPSISFKTPTSREGANQTEEQLLSRSLHGATPEIRQQAKDILDASQQRKLEIAKATTIGQMQGKETGIDIPGLASAIGEGQQSLSGIQGAFGLPVRAQVNTELLRQYPKFNINQSEANAKWITNPGNLRTISMIQGSLPRVNMLADQLANLPNANIPAINAIMRQAAIQTGKPEFASFESNRNAIVQEINTALSGSAQGSDMRIKIEMENLNASRSPAQIQAAISNLREALLARLEPSLTPPYPIEVVRGEKTLPQYIIDMRKKYKGKYGLEGVSGSQVPTESAPGISPAGAAYLKKLGL